MKVPSRRELRKRPRKAAPSRSLARCHPHPVFGAVPLKPTTVTDAGGAPVVVWGFDLDWQPPLPPGAVRGDPRRQTYCCDPPRYYYVDQGRTCVQCAASFVFGASEQKYWYETLGFRLDVTAVRCPPCRRKRRSDRAIRQTLALAVVEAAVRPADPLARIALAQATIVHVERFGTGDLDRALAACRKAGKLAPDFAQALYWEARIQETAGRGAKASVSYRAFLEAAGGKGPTALRKDAAARLAALRGPLAS